MPFWQLYYHIVTSTKNREPIITAEIEPEIYRLLRMKIYDLDELAFAINGISDHVHLVVSIPPKISVARFIGQIKASTSTLYNKSHPEKPHFFWQEEYGVFSFDKKRVANCVEYVEKQKEHHAQNNLILALESIESSPKINEETAGYDPDGPNWDL